jgi:hypothetical protein
VESVDTSFNLFSGRNHHQRKVLSKSDEFSLFYYEKELKNEEMNAYSLCRNKIYYKLKLRNRDMNENGNLGFLIWRSAYFR